MKHDLYHFIDDVYGVHNLSLINTSKYKVDHLDTKQFMVDAAHQIRDMIDRYIVESFNIYFFNNA